MNLMDAFLQQCFKTPHQLAFCEENYRLTYTEFKHQVEKLSSFLQQQCIFQQPIAIFLERGIDAAIAIYAVLKSGAIYLPLDVKNPISRVQLIIIDARVKCVIGQGERPHWLNEADNWLDITQFKLIAGNFLKTTHYTSVLPENIAAILYTSGSTGTPKGVTLSHAAMLNFANWAGETFKLNSKDNIASLAPFHFDLSVFDLFSALSRGASVYFMPSRLTLSPSLLTAWLATHEITCWYTVPSLLKFIVFKGGLEFTPLPALKQLLFAGEVFPTLLLRRLTQLLPATVFYNLYGPTETNVCCYWQVDKESLDTELAIPIGEPACGATLHIDQNQELWVTCQNNFSGYWQQGKLIPHDSYQAYRTGDKVSVNQKGEYCYHGRLDRMMKCSGYRVEPAEIERVLNQIVGVEACAVIGIVDASSGQRPVAVLVLKNRIILADIVKIAREKLASYMMPCQFKVLAALPILSNGKLDYLALYSLFDVYD